MSAIQAYNSRGGKIYEDDHTQVSALKEFQINWLIFDVTICVGCLEIPAHKQVLKNYIPYFKVMFTQNFSEKNMKVIKLQGVDADATASLIKFAYSSNLYMDVNNVQALYTAADYFDMKNAKHFCEHFLMEHIDAGNAFGVRQLGDLFKSVDLSKQTNEFIYKNFAEVTSATNEEFLALEKNDLVSLLSQSDLCVKSETEVLDAVKVWIEKDIDTRGQHIYELLQKVRLDYTKSKDLRAFAEFPPCRSSADCIELIYGAMNDQEETYMETIMTWKVFQSDLSQRRRVDSPRNSSEQILYYKRVSGLERLKRKFRKTTKVKR